MAYSPDRLVFKLLANTGSGEMNVDGTTPVNFDYVVPTNFTAYINRINMVLLDAAMTEEKFGGVSALTNGVLIKALDSDDTVLLDFLDGVTLKQNCDFALLAGTDAIATAGSGEDSLPVRWTISRASGEPVKLTEGQKIRLTVQDNLSALTKFRAMVQGYVEPDIVP